MPQVWQRRTSGHKGRFAKKSCISWHYTSPSLPQVTLCHHSQNKKSVSKMSFQPWSPSPCAPTLNIYIYHPLAYQFNLHPCSPQRVSGLLALYNLMISPLVTSLHSRPGRSLITSRLTGYQQEDTGGFKEFQSPSSFLWQEKGTRLSICLPTPV